MKTSPFQSRQYLTVFVIVTVAAVTLALLADNANLALAAAVLGLYVLHLLSVRFIVRGQQEQWEALRELEGVLGELGRAEEVGPGDGLAAVEVPAAGPAPGARGSSPAGDGAEQPHPRAATTTQETDASGSRGNGGGARGADAGTGQDDGEIPVPRHFALGTVAVIKEALAPNEVAQVLLEQRRRPRRRFGELAVELGLLEEGELEALLLTQQEGVYTKAEIRGARQRLQAYRDSREQALEEAV